MSLFKELKRRNVFRVGVAYIIVAWLIMQVGDTLAPALLLPEWSTSLLAFFLVLGLPLALFFAWAFEVTPEGLKKEKDVDRSKSITHKTGRKFDFIIIGALVLALGYFVWERQSLISQVAPASRSVGVLPFTNLSSDQEQEWFADGLTEEILNSLTRTPDLLVAARTSSFAFKGSNEDVRNIAATLGVDHILDGSVRRDRDTLRVTAQLIRASDGFHLWSETYDRTPDDIIEIQEDIATEIANALETVMDPEALALMVSTGTSSVPAFERYVEGLAFNASARATGDRNEVREMWRAFQEAVSLDPEFALAYRRLAEFWRSQLMGTNTWSGLTNQTPVEILSGFDRAINKAIEHANDSVERLGYHAYKARVDLQFKQALDLSTRYLEQRPNSHFAQELQLLNLISLRMYDDIEEEVVEYYERDGFDVRVMVVSLQALRDSGNDDLLRTFSNNAIERFPDNPGLLYQAHRGLLWVGDLEAANKLLQDIWSGRMPDHSRHLASLRQACAEGELAEANRLYASGIEKHADRAVTVYLSHMIMSRAEEAAATLMVLDEPKILQPLASYLIYGFFDPTPFPNLMMVLADQGILPPKVVDIPFRCKI